ncbi:30S ribosomal protein S17 [bacterium]|nr:30S ribosomal protein S17 [bacterium]
MNTRRRLTGVVIGNKMEKTVVVELTRRYRHPLYRKVVTSDKRVKAHDELNCNVGDEVVIVESKPISKTKRWAVQEIVKRAEFSDELPEA